MVESLYFISIIEPSWKYGKYSAIFILATKLSQGHTSGTHHYVSPLGCAHYLNIRHAYLFYLDLVDANDHVHHALVFLALFLIMP